MRKAKKYPISKGLAGVPDQASLTEAIFNRANSGAFYTTNLGYRLYNLSLASCERAQNVGQAYQEFRIRRITLAFKTTIDTFSAGNTAVPQLYYMVDKKSAVPNNFNIDTLSHMGALPRRFDDKKILIKYAPAVSQAATSDPGSLITALATSVTSPWLPTNNSVASSGVWVPSDIDHFGLSWMVAVPTGAQAVTYDVDIFVDFEFRKPLAKAPPAGSAIALSWDQHFSEVPPAEV